MPKRSSKERDDLAQVEAGFLEESKDEPVAEPIPAEALPRVKNPAAVALGRLGGKKGGPARAVKLSKERRQEIAKKAAAARWGKAK